MRLKAAVDDKDHLTIETMLASIGPGFPQTLSDKADDLIVDRLI